MPDPLLRFALLGAGTAGRARAAAISRDPRCALVAVYRGRHAASLGAPQVGSLEEAIEAADAVAVCSPSAAHPGQVEAALRASRHVVVEYPLATRRTEARRLFDLARSRGRVLHVEHIELLGGVAAQLRAHVMPAAVQHVAVSFERPGPASAPGSELALPNLARIHRALDFAGPIASVDEVHHAPGLLSASLTLGNGAPLTLRFRQAPEHRRSTRISVRAAGVEWRQDDEALFRDGAALTLLDTGPLFEQDHQAFMARLLRGAEPYVSEARILHALEVVERLRTGQSGDVDG